jgi:hypothetical protein
MGLVQETEFARNVVRNSAGIALNWQCQGRANRFVDNRIEGSCRAKNPTSCAPGTLGRCYNYADLYVRGGGSLELSGNEVVGTRCASPLVVWSKNLDLVIRGGRYEGGPNLMSGVVVHGAKLRIGGGARFEGVGLQFEAGARGAVTSSVEVVGVRERFRRDASAQVIVCPESPEACRRACQTSAAPAWCSD